MRAESSFKRLKVKSGLFAVGKLLLCVWEASLLRSRSANVIKAFLKGEGDINFPSLGNGEWLDVLEECGGVSAGAAPREGGTKSASPVVGAVDPADLVERESAIQGFPVAHGDNGCQPIDRVDGPSRRLGLVDKDTALPVEQTSEVDVIVSHRGLRSNVGELGEHPMPGQETVAEGQSRTKQSESSGVRREQVPTPKGKICSELGGNAETLEETASACTIWYIVTDCYHRSALSAVQIIMKPNATGTLSFPTLQYMGIDWNWSRNIASGRAYMLRPDADLAFWVHSEGNFKLSPFQRAFNQDLYGASLLLMSAFFARRRMFSMVIDGITA